MTPSRGFTLVEVLVALIVLAVGVLGLAAETAALMRHLAQAQRTAWVSAAAAARLERLRTGACTTRADGAEALRHGDVPLALLEWRWTSPGDSTHRVRLVTLPAGAARRPLARPETLTAVIPCRR